MLAVSEIEEAKFAAAAGVSSVEPVSATCALKFWAAATVSAVLLAEAGQVSMGWMLEAAGSPAAGPKVAAILTLASGLPAPALADAKFEKFIADGHGKWFDPDEPRRPQLRPLKRTV
mgnify:CR=1 FL=1